MRLQSKSGFSLIEVMMAVAIMGIISLAMMQMMESQGKQVRALKAILENGNIGTLIARYIGSAAALKQSAPGPYPLANQNFQKCVLGTGSGTCDMSLTNQGFYLVDPAGTPVAGPGGPTPAGGAAPIFYDMDGVKCAALDPNTRCIFKAETTFEIIQCNGTGPICSGGMAQEVKVRYIVSQGPDMPNVPRMRPTSGDATFAVPFPGFIGGTGQHLALWNTSSDLASSNVKQIPQGTLQQIRVNDDTNSISNATSAFIVSGDNSSYGNAFVTGNDNVGGNSNVTGNSNISGNSNVTLNSNIGGNSVVAGNSSVGLNLSVNGNSTVLGNSSVGLNLSVTGNTAIAGTTNSIGTISTNGMVVASGNMLTNSAIVASYDITAGQSLITKKSLYMYSGGDTSLCGAGNNGTIRNVNGALEVCDATAGQWRWAAGNIDSSTLQYISTAYGKVFPHLPHLYLCPLGGGSSCDAATPTPKGPPCGGQITNVSQCCKHGSPATMVPCTAL